MSELTIKTNNVPRDLLSGYELTDKERQELDYIAKIGDIEAWSNCVNQFFRYRGEIYDLHEFVRIVPYGTCDNSFCHRSDNPKLLAWDGIQTDSFFSGIVVRYCDDYESVVVGLLLS